MLNSAILHTGQTDFVDSEIKGEQLYIWTW